ncbi:MAG: ornithine decarboxylase [Veillonella sp.]|uniref:ornithine decarboxylase n=1 Tax=Veillonella sp. TaxID=1926307 RepID=UPI0025536C0C|nr:ornithine decarboxylase [Veillonella sp.]MDK7739862.1 ornithine decarboxylase [Veillonella nakazawae]MDU0851508.1 ornithine decarboxylase [Veillonella sp.]MDU0924794.1 ornithine decarboxylase [Veillonella sp.]MDU1410383.1 ornithine decarboxylase [Veillonella sp.]MDU1501278.1 ornithine decarboxylase [Veillonella sp.]
MKHLKIAFTDCVKTWITSIEDRTCIPINETDFTNIGAVVVSASEMDVLDNEQIRSFGIPAIVMVVDPSHTISFDMERIGAVIDVTSTSINDYKGTIEQIVASYEALILPPFFKALSDYVGDNNAQFDCPGHQGGQFFGKHPTGRAFYDFFGEHIFRADLCNADVKLGDLLIHEGYAHDAQAHAAAVYNADKTYFVLNGTSSANKVVLNALLTPGDIILYDRNNHKSICHGGLVMSGATPIYLETARNPFGSIGGILEHCFDESYIRNLIHEKDPNKAKADRPIRLAVIQLGTYDGTIYNARQVVDKIGHLCDYIFFDSAWVGYEQFIPMMKDCSPLLLELGPNDPGILVTQSVHKQQAGFSQTSQIHKKDKHIKGQDRYVDHKRFNNSFMMHASTSPFYPLFASLDVNAKMHEGELGKQLWRECIELGIDARKSVLSHCKYLRPLVPPIVHGKKWEEGNTQEMANDVSYFAFEPNAKWHSFKGYGEGQYFIDPCKFQLITPGINVETGAYEDFGIHANILANYLRENRIIPEKCDLNTILFLMTPAESKAKMDALVDQLVRFEELIERNAPMEEVLPSIYYSHLDKYKGYHIRRLCQEMHDFYKDRNVSTLQQRLFSKEYFPEYVMNPQEANFEFQRNKGELVPLDEAEGRIALEGALPYPPGVLCVQPGERWSRTACDYFLALEEGINQLPGFAPEIQGVYLIEQPDGSKKAYGYVLKKEYEM